MHLSSLAAVSLLPAAALARAHFDTSPIHLLQHHKRQDAGQSPAKLDNVFFSPDFTTPAFRQRVQSLVAENQATAADAVAKGLAGAPLPLLNKRAANAWSWGGVPVRGVNLGGWLVTEPWIVPSLYDSTGDDRIVDEWTFGQYLGYTDAHSRLSKHWQTFITEADIEDIASAGLNHVRIPIGYWAFEVASGEPYVKGQFDYLLRAIGWCRNHGVRVLVDLHGAPGSQNGFDNSGRRGAINWHTSPANVETTKRVLKTLSAELAQPQYSDVVTGVQLLNEPAGYASDALLRTYKEFAYGGYQSIRYPNDNSEPSPLTVSIHDAFQSLDSWRGFMPPPKFQDVVLDTHIYQIFSNDAIAYTDAERIQKICSMANYLATSNRSLWTMVGEWSFAPTDCARDLNGRGQGARYDGTFPGSSRVGSCRGKSGSHAGFSSEYRAFLRKFFEVQTQVYEANTQGWIAWTWKTENADDWSYSAGIAAGYIPSDPNDRMYGNQCASNA